LTYVAPHPLDGPHSRERWSLGCVRAPERRSVLGAPEVLGHSGASFCPADHEREPASCRYITSPCSHIRAFEIVRGGQRLAGTPRTWLFGGRRIPMACPAAGKHGPLLPDPGVVPSALRGKTTEVREAMASRLPRLRWCRVARGGELSCATRSPAADNAQGYAHRQLSHSRPLPHPPAGRRPLAPGTPGRKRTPNSRAVDGRQLPCRSCPWFGARPEAGSQGAPRRLVRYRDCRILPWHAGVRRRVACDADAL
jgi:hypothetical protein